MYLKGHIGYDFFSVIIYCRKILYFIHNFRIDLLFSLVIHSKNNISSDHHLCQFTFTGIFFQHISDNLAMLDDRDTVCQLHNLSQLMRDDNDRLSLFLQILQSHHQFVNFLRCKYSCWLIQDQYIYVSV